MSGIFNLFGGTGNAARNQALGPTDTAKNLTMNSRTFGNMQGIAVKNTAISRAKPKGLSIRSNSDLNVYQRNAGTSTPSGKTSPSKATFLKTEIAHFDSGMQCLSPRSKDKVSKMQIIKSKQQRALSSKNKSPNNTSLKRLKDSEESVFKKPLTPMQNTKKILSFYPEPEKLAGYYDHKNYIDCSFDDLSQEFARVIKTSKSSITPYEDEGFDSDPELITPPTISAFDAFDIPSQDDNSRPSSPELPSISDFEDDDDYF